MGRQRSSPAPTRWFLLNFLDAMVQFDEESYLQKWTSRWHMGSLEEKDEGNLNSSEKLRLRKLKKKWKGKSSKDCRGPRPIVSYDKNL